MVFGSIIPKNGLLKINKTLIFYILKYRYLCLYLHVIKKQELWIIKKVLKN